MIDQTDRMGCSVYANAQYTQDGREKIFIARSTGIPQWQEDPVRLSVPLSYPTQDRRVVTSVSAYSRP